MDKVYFLIIPLVLIIGTVVYIGYFLTGLDSFLKFIFMPDCAHPLVLLGFTLMYYIYKEGKAKKRYYSLLSYVCSLLISIGFASLFYAFYVKNFSWNLSLFTHITMVSIGFFVFFKNIKNLRIRGIMLAGLFLTLDVLSDLFLGTKHPYIYSNLDILNGFIVRFVGIIALIILIYCYKKIKIRS